MTAEASTLDVEQPTLLITGATGKTGGHAARLLLERGHRVRALVHTFDDRAARLRDSGADVVVGDLTDDASMRQAVKGVRSAYFVYPITGGLLEATVTFAQAAAEAGVSSIVNMSQISARRDSASNAARTHWLAERALDWAPLAVTHLRPTFFAEWLLIFGESIRTEGVLRLPFGHGRHAPVTAEDQGRVIAAILEQPEPHAGKIYPLFGAVEMNHDEIAEEISRAAGRPVRYEPVEIPAWIDDIKARGFPAYLAQHLSEVAVDYRNGIFSGNNDVVERVGGRKPTTVGEFVTAHKTTFTD
jgi:NAD(P)H dehydrogenase (quinone)